MPRIFLCYRRIDSEHMTDRIHEKLCDAFGSENIFLDVGKIPLGIDFRKHIQREIMRSDVVLAIVGQKWLDELNKRIEEKKDDHLSIEIEQSLMNDKLIIPVLIDNAHMPSAEELPETIRDFHYKEAIKINRTPYFDNDIQRLLEGISISLEYHKQFLQHDQIAEFLETTLEMRRIDRPTVMKAWSEAQKLIFKYSDTAGDTITVLPNLMEAANFFHIHENTIIMEVKDDTIRDMLRHDLRIKWVERALSNILNAPVVISYIEAVPF